MSNRITDAGSPSLLDTLLRALETLPGIDHAAWDLGCLRVALRIARATGTEDDLARANLALDALGPDSRSCLLGHVATLARRRERPSPATAEAEGAAGDRPTSFLTTLFRRRGSSSGVTARDRLMREVAGGR